MITKEKIKNGFKNHIISIESEFGGCISLCCRIGEYAFYFLGFDDEGLTCDTYWKTYTLENTVEMIYKILKDIQSAEEDGLDLAELEYYDTVLSGGK